MILIQIEFNSKSDAKSYEHTMKTSNPSSRSSSYIYRGNLPNPLGLFQPTPTPYSTPSLFFFITVDKQVKKMTYGNFSRKRKSNTSLLPSLPLDNQFWKEFMYSRATGKKLTSFYRE